MATLDVKFTKFDNRPWGFRLAGGSDFPQPLTVIRVSEGSLAECMGLKVGDVVVKLNDRLISDLTHGQAHEALVLAGNNFVLGVRRKEDPTQSVEDIEDKIEPYMLPIEDILFAPAEDNRETTPDEVPQIEDESVPLVESEPEQVPVEVYPEKPRDENSEIVANTNLTDEEIAQLILDEEEVLNEKGVLGVNFKKLRPRAPLLKESKVFQELQEEANSEPSELQELKRQTTFLQKPERPIPKPRRTSQSEEDPEVEPYRVVIKKQPKKSVTERLLQKGLIEASRVKSPEPVEVNEPEKTPETRGTWSLSSYVEITMLPINETSEEPIPRIEEASSPVIVYHTYEITSNVYPKRGKPRLCRRGRYAKRCLDRVVNSLKSPSGKTKPRLLRRAHYFERIVGDVKRGVENKGEDGLLRLLMIASLACSIRETYDSEILHRGSSRRNSRRLSCRRESNGFEAGLIAFKAKRESDGFTTLQSRYAEGKRRLSTMSMFVADKVTNAMRTDLARGLAYAMVPCASALAFFVFNYAKRFNNNE